MSYKEYDRLYLIFGYRMLYSTIYSGFPENHFMGKKYSLDIQTVSNFSFSVFYFSLRYLIVTFWNEYFWTHYLHTVNTMLHLFIGKAWLPAVRISLVLAVDVWDYLDMHMYLHLHVIPLVMGLWEYICVLKVNFCKLISQIFLILNVMGQRFKCYIFLFPKLNPASSVLYQKK